jgi:hypothetical protein
MQLGEAIIAGIVLAVCAVMLARLAMGTARREQFDIKAQRAWARGPRTWWLAWQRGQAQRRERRDAARREAQAARMESAAHRESLDVIARARKRAQVEPAAAQGHPRVDVEVDGNVIRPHAFKGSAKGPGNGEPGATQRGNDTLH